MSSGCIFRLFQASYHRHIQEQLENSPLIEDKILPLQVGTSSVVYPAAMFAPQVAGRGVPVAEFNMEDTPATMRFKYASPAV